MQVRNVIMDLGGVMLDWNPDHLLTPFQADPKLRAELRAAIFAHDWHQYDRGLVTEDLLVERLQMRTGQTQEQILAIVEAVRESLAEKPETVKLVRDLHRRGFAIYCLSNMPGPMFEYLQRRHAFWDVFSGIVISAHIRLMKPEPQIYLHLLERFGLAAQESVFVDDLQVNVDAARAVGLHAIRFQTAAQVEQELEPLLVTHRHS